MPISRFESVPAKHVHFALEGNASIFALKMYHVPLPLPRTFPQQKLVELEEELKDLRGWAKEQKEAQIDKVRARDRLRARTGLVQSVKGPSRLHGNPVVCFCHLLACSGKLDGGNSIAF